MSYYDMHVSSGMISSGIVLSSCDLHVSSGGEVCDTVVNGYYCAMNIYGGGVASNTVMSYGTLHVLSGGMVDGLFCNVGSLFVSSGGVIENCEVNGHVFISGGGTVSTTVISSGGETYVHDNILDDTTINSGGYMNISSGGVANSTIVNSGGYMYISISGVAENTRVNGNVIVCDGGTARVTEVNSGGSMEISSGGNAADIKENGGCVYVQDGGSATFVSNTVSGLVLDSTMTVHSNTVASDITVETYGILQIYSGGVGNGIILDSYGSMNVYSGAVVSDVATFYSSYIDICSGATVSNMTVNDIMAGYGVNGQIYGLTLKGGGLFVDSSGSVCNAVVSEWTCLNIDGYASGVTVSSGGSMSVYFGGTALAVKEDGGYVGVGDDAVVTFVPNTISGLELNYGRSASVHSGTVASGVTVDDFCAIYVYSGGIASNVSVNRSGNLVISSGGYVHMLEADKYADIYIASGGSVLLAYDPWENYYNATFEEGSVISYFYDAGVYIGEPNEGLAGKYSSVSGVTVEGWQSALVLSGGTAANTTVYGRMEVSSGGKISGTEISGTYYADQSGLFIYSGGTADSTIVNSGGNMYVSGGVANDTTLEYDGSMYVFSGGVANDTTVEYGGRMYISSGGVANDTTVNSWGDLNISSGGMADGLILNEGFANVESGGIVSGVVVSEGCLYVSSGGVADGISVYDGNLYVSSGGTATNIFTTPWNRDAVYAESGAYVTYVISNYAGVYVMSNNQIVSNASGMNGKVLSGTSMYVLSGGTAVSTTLHNDAELAVLSGGIVSGAVVSGGSMTVSSGGSASIVTVRNNGTLTVSSGGRISGVTGEFFLHEGGFYNGRQYKGIDSEWYDEVFTVNKVFSPYNMYMIINTIDPIFHSGLHHIRGGLHYGAKISSGAVIYSEDPYMMTFNGVTVSSGGSMIINHGYFNDLLLHTGAVLQLSGGWQTHMSSLFRTGVVSGADIQGIFTAGDKVLASNLVIRNGGIAYITANAVADTVEVGTSGNLYIAMAGSAENIMISGGSVHVATGGRISGLEVGDSGSLYLYGGAVLDGEINVRGTITLDDMAVNNGTMEFVLTSPQDKAMVNDLSLISGGSFSIDVSDADVGEYVLAKNAAGFTGCITVKDSVYEYGSIRVGGSLDVGDKSYVLNLKGGDLTVKAVTNGISGLSGNSGGVSWNPISGVEEYFIRYSQDSFDHAFTVRVESAGLDTFCMPGGNWQYQVSLSGSNWTDGSQITAAVTAAAAKKFISDADDITDLFFARKNGVWSGDYKAVHQGEKNGWQGTGESVALAGKNVIADVFNGSDDANILVLTDDTNGDALFVEDVYTSFGKDAARLSQINEIRAGSGDDIVDMTGQRFAYDGSEMTIRGGDGDDVIWAAGGDNDLFGDAGNDRITGSTGFDLIIGGDGNDSMISGGGDDIFAFGENWGRDTVEITDDSEITLWFADGSPDNWDSGNLVYSDGVNSVTVSGTDASRIVLKFGDDASRDYDDMLEIGAFDGASSKKIFEENGSGQLA